MKEESQDYYSFHYERILNTGFLGRLKAFTHTFQEKQIPSNFTARNVIEVGAGSGTHKNFVKHPYIEYLQTDLRGDLPVGVVQADAENLSEYKDATFDRLIATCLLAHLKDPENALKEWRRLVRHNGIVSIYIPCEPGLILRLFRLLTTNLKGRKRGVNHYEFHYREHRNYFISLKYAIYSVFKGDDVKSAAFPSKYVSWNFNFFVVYTIHIKKNTNE